MIRSGAPRSASGPGGPGAGGRPAGIVPGPGRAGPRDRRARRQDACLSEGSVSMLTAPMVAARPRVPPTDDPAAKGGLP